MSGLGVRGRTTPIYDGSDSEFKATVEAAASEAAPTTTSQGVDCEAWHTASVAAVGGGSLTAGEVRVYVLPKGGGASDWIELGASADVISLDASTRSDVTQYEVADFARVAARVTVATGDSVTRFVAGS